MLITRLLAYNFTQESLILAGGVIYVAIRFGLSHFLRHYTVHRGMFHSFPSMAIFGELTYLLFYGESMFVRLFMVSAVCLGFFIHLLLDEIYSVEWDGRPRVKKSFGTAMKFVGNGWWPNVTCYVKLAVLTFLVLNDPGVVHQIYTDQGQEVAKNLGQTVKDEFNSMARSGAKSSGDLAPVAVLRGGPADGTSRSTTLSANSSAVPSPTYAWPSQTASAPQTMVTSAATNGLFPVDSPPSAGLPSRASRAPRRFGPQRTNAGHSVLAVIRPPLDFHLKLEHNKMFWDASLPLFL